jgi:hypothetical protein
MNFFSIILRPSSSPPQRVSSARSKESFEIAVYRNAAGILTFNKEIEKNDYLA